MLEYTIVRTANIVGGEIMHTIVPVRYTGPSRSTGTEATILADTVMIDPTDGETWAEGRTYRKDGTLANRIVRVLI